MAVKKPETTDNYYVPEQSVWPILGAISLFLIAVGGGLYIPAVTGHTESAGGGWLLLLGLCCLLLMFSGWFNHVIRESLCGLYSRQMDRSFRQGMAWFIISEVMFFAAFFGALFYARTIAVPWLGGAGNNEMTGALLWPGFEAVWPLLTTPDGTETRAMGWFGLPLINTLILLTSSWTLHRAHHLLLSTPAGAVSVAAISGAGVSGGQESSADGGRASTSHWLLATVVLGALFLVLQGEEYVHAWSELGLKMESGIYGSTFFLLTGFHGLHVTLGTVMLLVIWLRLRRGHFSATNCFAFEAASWYWHFVDVVWLCLFVFVYVL